ncbi:MAG TPA: TolB family protein [Candidatus Egerieimonas intestinavium]|uniref:TolB family protein n=1 Tax=Candidatus Egerieimonas intestinavium TaxID=2840777 RepID=A0A9D1EM69_9FIRM|nr:TolB family protein [Candidatus Egerieimonas intestinavium]
MSFEEYNRNRCQRCRIEIFDLETGESRTVKQFDRVVEAPNWTEDGKYLVFNSYGKLYRLNLETGEEETIETGEAVTCNNDHVLEPGGTGIAFSSGIEGDEDSRIFVKEGLQGKVRMVVSEPLSYLHGWSPDRKTLAFCAARSYEGKLEWDIYSVPAKGGEEVRLTDAPGLNDGPEYSRDGKYIWFNSVRTGLMQVWRMDADGKRQTQMTFDENMNSWFPHVSPDGTKVVYVCYHKGDLEPGEHLPDKNVEIRMIPAEGGQEKTLVKLFGGQGTMNVNSWSPDSKKFAYVSYEGEE